MTICPSTPSPNWLANCGTVCVASRPFTNWPGHNANNCYFKNSLLRPQGSWNIIIQGREFGWPCATISGRPEVSVCVLTASWKNLGRITASTAPTTTHTRIFYLIYLCHLDTGETRLRYSATTTQQLGRLGRSTFPLLPHETKVNRTRPNALIGKRKPRKRKKAGSS